MIKTKQSGRPCEVVCSLKDAFVYMNPNRTTLELMQFSITVVS